MSPSQFYTKPVESSTLSRLCGYSPFTQVLLAAYLPAKKEKKTRRRKNLIMCRHFVCLFACLSFFSGKVRYFTHLSSLPASHFLRLKIESGCLNIQAVLIVHHSLNTSSVHFNAGYFIRYIYSEQGQPSKVPGLSMKFKDKEYKDCPLEIRRKSALSYLYSTKIPYVGVGIVKAECQAL